MDELSSNQKGAIAETAIVAHATRLGIDVFRPVFEAGRYDMIFAFPSGELARIQCKWADMSEGAVVIRSYSCRRGAGGMIVRRYGVEDVDAVVAYCAPPRPDVLRSHRAHRLASSLPPPRRAIAK